MEKSVFGLVVFTFLSPIHAASDLSKCANKIDCNIVRLQQYFCIARCISFVRDEAPSALTNNGTCPAVNWWWRPTTTTTTAPTTIPVATGPCVNIKAGFEKCCRKSPYDDLFPDEDSDCTNDDLITSREYRNLRKDSELFSFVSPTGDLQLDKVADSAYFFYDCMFKVKKLYDDGELNAKRIASYLKKNADDSSADTIDDQVPQCIKLTKRIPQFDEKYKIFTNSSKNVRVYQSPYVFNVCIRRALFAQCTPSKSDDCTGVKDNINNCVITIPKS
ncbi:uncharacterized protein LOC135934634 [Cloeon dipterum]|uniref:uncharacterized protein LOC135934634 n=1 Tax=Cloeon dipterum TaxID=197152 RepID=UPI00321F8809